MFCSKCGKELPEGTVTCPECGESLTKNIDFQDVKGYAAQKMQETTQSVQMLAKDFKDQMKEEKEGRKIKDVSELFVQPDEKQISCLGKGYLNNFLRDGVLGKGFGVLTDKRFYYKGKCYNKVGGKIYKTDEEKTIDIQDITASGFVYRRNVFLLILFIILISATMAGFMLACMSWEDGLATLILFGGGGLSAVIMAAYLLYKRAVYEITYMGGGVAIRVSGYGVKEIKEFDRELHRAKDEAVRTLK